MELFHYSETKEVWNQVLEQHSSLTNWVELKLPIDFYTLLPLMVL